MFFKPGLLAVLLFISACRETIVHDLSESEANKMLAHLDSQSLQVFKEKQTDGRWSLSLPESQAAAAISSLTKNKLFRQEYPALSEKSGFIMSREEERFRFERALSREIEATLAGLPTVLQARVHLYLPASDPVFGQSQDLSKSSASVLLISAANGVDKSEVTALVSGASGVPANAVSVIITKNSGTDNQAKSVLLPDQISAEQQMQINPQPAADNSKNREDLFAVNLKQIPIRITDLCSKIFFSLRLMPWAYLLGGLCLLGVFVIVSRMLNRKAGLIV